MRRLVGSVRIIALALARASVTSWSTLVSVAWIRFGRYLNEIWMEVVLGGSKRRLPCRAVEKGETASVPSGTGIEDWEPGTTASCAARRRRSNESIAARDVAHSALYSCPGRTATIVS